MPEPRPSDDTLRRFLLGRMTEAERESIERACLDRDSEVFAEVSAIEDDLRSDYAYGRLRGDDRTRFEERHLSTPDGRTRQAFFATLATSARQHESRARAAVGVAPPRRMLWPALAVTGMLILMAAVALLAVRSAILNEELSRLRFELAQRAASSGEVAKLNEDLQRERSARQDLDRRLTELSSRGTSPMFALWLMPGLTRAGGATTPRIRETDVAQGLQVTLAFPASLAVPVVTAVAVRDVDGRTIWTSAPVTPQDQAATVTVPGHLLTRGDYEVVLRGGKGREALQDLASYYIRITAP